MLDLEAIQDLEAIINTTWGRSSTIKSPTSSITCKITGPASGMLKYVCVVNIGSVLEAEAAKKRHEAESLETINEYIKSVKSQYKENTGKSINIKMVKHDISIEVINMSAYIPKRTCYLRINGHLELDS